ncbi:MAG TPA: hypothetical protein VEI74_11955 [Candidatus Methylomirabilis sp.]|nr:hypothetical protein [Candidatus Methylomirabilis sp.]
MLLTSAVVIPAKGIMFVSEPGVTVAEGGRRRVRLYGGASLSIVARKTL